MSESAPAAKTVEQMKEQIHGLLPEEKKEDLKKSLAEEFEKNKGEAIHFSQAERDKLAAEIKNLDGDSAKIAERIIDELHNELFETKMDANVNDYAGDDSKDDYEEIDTNKTRDIIENAWADETKDLTEKQKDDLQKRVLPLLNIADKNSQDKPGNEMFGNSMRLTGDFNDEMLMKVEARAIETFIKVEAKKMREKNEKLAKEAGAKKEQKAEAPGATSSETDSSEAPKTEPKKSAEERSEEQFDKASKLIEEAGKLEWKNNIGKKILLYLKAASAYISGMGLSGMGSILALVGFDKFGAAVEKMGEKAEAGQTAPEKTAEAEAKKHTENLKTYFNVDNTTFETLSKIKVSEIFADDFNVATLIKNKKLDNNKSNEIEKLITFVKKNHTYNKNEAEKDFKEILFSEQAKKALTEKMEETKT